MAMIASTQAGLEAQDSAADQISKMLDRFNQRLTLDNLRLIERYVKSEIFLHVHFHFKWKVADQYIAYLQRAHILSGPEKSGHPGQIAILEKTALLQHMHVEAQKIHASVRVSNGDDNSVLIDVVQSVQYPNLVPLPSFVHFGIVKRIDSILPQSALYFSVKKGFVFLSVIRDGEVEILVRSRRAKSNEAQLIGQVIESAPEVLDCVPRDGNNDSGNWCDTGYLIAQFSKLRIFLFDDAIGMSAEEGVDLPFEIDDVLFGPFNFYPDERKSFIGSQKSGV